jgi:hypothetical protein
MRAYYVTPRYDVAMNFRVGSVTLARAIICTFYPNLKQRLLEYPQGLCPRTRTPDKPVVLLVRDPVEKFRSALAKSRLSFADGLRGVDVHFWHQASFVTGLTRLYRFPDHLDAAAGEIGLPVPLLRYNQTESKPDLSPAEVDRVREVYADDVALYDGILAPGQEVF